MDLLVGSGGASVHASVGGASIHGLLIPWFAFQLAEPLFTHLRDRIRMFEGFAQTESVR